jgi:FAD/FMN-containing dehydrogenase
MAGPARDPVRAPDRDPRRHPGSAPQWRSWSGLTTARPALVRTPSDTAEVVDAVRTARAHGRRVKMVGSGHSFTDIAVTDGVLLLPDRMVGVTAVDRDAMTVTVLAGTPLHVLNRQLDVVTGDGSLVHARPSGTASERALWEAGRVGLGALGVVTAVTLLVEPAFTLRAVEEPMTWSRVVDGFEELASSHEHFEAYWFPHTDRMLTKADDRTSDEVEPLSRVRAYVDDELLSNTVFGILNRIGNTVPRAVPPINALSSRALTARTYSDVSHRVLTSSRRVVFKEMEYAVPREVGMPALREVRSLMEAEGWRVSFPVEIRHAPRDDVWLSTASDRDTVYLAFHTNARTDHTAYFAGVERVLTSYDGRPHWGKLHTRRAEDLAATYPRFADFVELRDRMDPDRLFTNDYLERVLTL